MPPMTSRATNTHRILRGLLDFATRLVCAVVLILGSFPRAVAIALASFVRPR